MRVIRFLLVAAFFAPAVGAQERPVGWIVRFDHEGVTEADVQQLAVMDPGWHITTGQGAGIYYDPGWTASGNYKVSTTIFLFDPGRRHREAYGIFFGGRHLADVGQSYSYFLLRDTGEYLIKTRQGAETANVVGWTASDAIMEFPGGDEQAKNVIEVAVGSTMVDFYVNGTKVHSLPRSEIDTEGTLGLRLNHGLNMHVSEVKIEKM